MPAAKRPKEGWSLEARCPGCGHIAAVTLALAGGRMPETGAVRLEARCASCGHTWTLPAKETASRRFPEKEA